MAELNRDKIAVGWAKRGFSCDLWTDSPGKRWQCFTHSTDELVLVLEGEMEFEISGKIYHPKPGVELLIPAGVLHSTYNFGKGTARWLYGYKQR